MSTVPGTRPVKFACQPDPFVTYALHLFADYSALQVEVREAAGGFTDVYYGDDASRPCALRIPKTQGFGVNDIPAPPTDEDLRFAAVSNAAFPFDFFEAVRFWLSDQGNAGAPPSAYDEHERLRASESAQELRGVREVPVVNAYFALLQAYIEARLEIRAPQSPSERGSCVVILTHDVDLPINPWDATQDLWLAGLALANHKPRESVNRMRSAGSRLWNAGTLRSERRWLFDEIMKSENRFGFRSTFFFASLSRAEGSFFDVAYDVRTPRFRRLIEKLTAEDWEVGLHVSYDARQSAERIAAERVRLESITKRRVQGTRHHYWHMARPMWQTLADHGKAGISYDTSIAFNEQPGYRLGIAFPFYPWDPRSKSALPTLQIPTLFMDGSFFYDLNQTVENVIRHVAALLEDLKRLNGVVAIDWHDYTSYPASLRYRVWGEAYLEILNLLAADHRISVQSCTQFLSTWNRRPLRVRVSEVNHPPYELTEPTSVCLPGFFA